MKALKVLPLALVISLASVAHAGVNISPMFGYHHSGKAWDEQREELKNQNKGYAKDNGTAKGIGLGVELSPSISLELEYLDASGKTRKDDTTDFDQKNMSLNLLVNSDFLLGDYENQLKPYLLLGAGKGDYKVNSKASGDELVSESHFITNFGVGAKYRVTDLLALKSELRGIYNTGGSWLEGLATVGLQVTLGGHLMPNIPEPPSFDFADMPEAEPEPEVAPQPKAIVITQPKDTDRDGVIDAKDKCQNTPAGTMVDANGCTKQLKMDLRVFFDVNKATVKPRFKPEVARVAQAMKQYGNTKAVIEGHTSNSGSRALNKRLSQQRADAIRAMLVNEYGISTNRVSAVGYGPDKPIAPNTNAEGRAMNRRVHAIIK